MPRTATASQPHQQVILDHTGQFREFGDGVGTGGKGILLDDHDVGRVLRGYLHDTGDNLLDTLIERHVVGCFNGLQNNNLAVVQETMPRAGK